MKLARRRVITKREGFSVLEVLIAAAILSVAAGSLVQLFLLSISANRHARAATYAVMLAQQKIEQLRTLPLAPSPPDALERNSAGYFDFVGAAGQELDPEGGEAAAPSGSAYIRRWAVDPLPADPAGSLVLRVAVVPVSGGAPVTLVTVARREGL